MQNTGISAKGVFSVRVLLGSNRPNLRKHDFPNYTNSFARISYLAGLYVASYTRKCIAI